MVLSPTSIGPWPILKGQKGQTKVNIGLIRDFYVENYPVKLQLDPCNFWWVITFTRFWAHPAHPPAHPPAQSRTSLPVQLQHDAGKIWCIIIFTSTVKLLNNGHPFCRGLVAVVEECPLVRICWKMSTNTRVWRGQGRLIYTKSDPRSFRPAKKWTDLQDRAYQWYI